MNENPTPSAAPRFTRQATAREFLAVVFRRKWIILGLFLVTTATVITVALTTPTTYISSGRILVKRGERQSALRPDRQIFGDWEQDLGSEMQVMKSQSVVRRAKELVVQDHGSYLRVLAPGRCSVPVMYSLWCRINPSRASARAFSRVSAMCQLSSTRQFLRSTILPCLTAAASAKLHCVGSAFRPSSDSDPMEMMPIPCLPARWAQIFT